MQQQQNTYKMQNTLPTYFLQKVEIFSPNISKKTKNNEHLVSIPQTI